MARNRLLPFGYRMENGEIKAHPIEAPAVAKLYSDYLSGMSLHALSDRMTVPFSEGAAWNDQRVYAVLKNKNYLGTDTFPRLIEPELFEAVQRMRSSKSHFHTELPEEITAIRKLTVCKECGGRVLRYGGVKRAEWWDCRDRTCGRFPVKMTDQIITDAVLDALNAAIRNPALLDTDIPETAYTPTAETIRQKNEVRRMAENSAVDYERIKAEVYRLAEMQYRCCTYSDVPQKTERLKALLTGREKQNTIDVGLLESCVRRILVSHFCTIEVEFINGTVFSERSDTA